MKTLRAHSWYSRAVWRGPNGIRLLKLRRDPICEVKGCDRPATTVDHRKAFMLGRTEQERWYLFVGGMNCENLRSSCQQHHDEKTLAFESGREEFNPLSPTGDAGRQFSSANVSQAQIDAALPHSAAEIDELLAGVDDL